MKNICKNIKYTLLLILLFSVCLFMIACGDKINNNSNDNSSLIGRETAVEISSYEDLLSMQAEHLTLDDNKYYKLTADIDCGGNVWQTIGSQESPFTCDFDGNGYTISNFVIDESSCISSNDKELAGFFGFVQDADIKNVNFANYSFVVYGIIETKSMGIIAETSGNVNVENIGLTNISITYEGDFGSSEITFGNIIGSDLATGIRKNLSVQDISINVSTFDGALTLGGLIGKSNLLNNIEKSQINKVNFSTVFNYGSKSLNFGVLVGEFISIDENLQSSINLSEIVCSDVYFSIMSFNDDNNYVGFYGQSPYSIDTTGITANNVTIDLNGELITY